MTRDDRDAARVLAARFIATGASEPEVLLALQREQVAEAEAKRLIDEIGPPDRARQLLAALPQQASLRRDPGHRRRTIWRPEYAGALVGSALLIGGVWGTVASYSSASPGDRFTLWWGAILLGGWTLLKAVARAVE